MILENLTYEAQPSLKVYYWKKRGERDLCAKAITPGHVAVDIKVPFNRYAHRIFTVQPIAPGKPIPPGFPPSYNVYRDGTSQDIYVTVVHCDNVSESVNLSKQENSNEYLYAEDISPFLSRYLRMNAAYSDVTFPLRFSEWIAASCQYRHDQNYFYLSFAPQHSVTTGRALFGTHGDCLIRVTEWKTYGEPDETQCINCLDHQRIYTQAMVFRHRIQKSNAGISQSEFLGFMQWGLAGHNHTCSSLVLSLLRDNGHGAIKQVPAFARPGTLQSAVLLSLRPVFATAVLFPVCYNLIFEDSALMTAMTILQIFLSSLVL